ncbi:MAG: hypothetical protein ACODAA_06325 [Gemmatimonadota bacterium]
MNVNDRTGDWNDLVESSLARDVPGELDSDLVARVEAGIERKRAAAADSARGHDGLLVPLFAVWLVLAAGLVVLHVQAAPEAYEALLAALRLVLGAVRLDLILVAGAVLLLTGAAAPTS